jgi:hypothetical protein
MTAYRLDEAGPLYGSANRSLLYDFVQVMAPVFSRVRIDGNLGRGKHPLPAPFFGRIGIFSVQGVWQIHAAEAVGEVVLMQFPYSCEMSDQRRFHLVFPRHNRKALRLFGPHDVVYPARVEVENMTVQEEQGVERLILRGGAHAMVSSKRGQKVSNLLFSHLRGAACRQTLLDGGGEAL